MQMYSTSNTNWLWLHMAERFNPSAGNDTLTQQGSYVRPDHFPPSFSSSSWGWGRDAVPLHWRGVLVLDLFW